MRLFHSFIYWGLGIHAEPFGRTHQTDRIQDVRFGFVFRSLACVQRSPGSLIHIQSGHVYQLISPYR